MKNLRYCLAALVVLALFPACQFLEQQFDVNPTGFSQEFQDSYHNGLTYGSCLKENERLPQKSVLYAIVYSPNNWFADTFRIKEAGTFVDGYKQRVHIAGTDTLNLSLCGDGEKYFWMWRKERFDLLYQPNQNLFSNLQQDSYTGALKSAMTSTVDAENALIALAAQHGKQYPAGYYLQGIVFGYPDCVGDPTKIVEGRDDLYHNYYGLLNGCYANDNQTYVSFDVLVENALGECRRITRQNYWQGTDIMANLIDITCPTYSDTAVAIVNVRVFQQVSGNPNNDNFTYKMRGVWYKPNQTSTKPAFWLESYTLNTNQGGWGEGRCELQPFGGSNWLEIRAKLGMTDDEKIIALVRPMEWLKGPSGGEIFLLRPDGTVTKTTAAAEGIEVAW